MADKAGFPFTALRFDARGVLTARPDGLVPSGTTDLIVLAHGWKNDRMDADALFAGILGHLRAAAGSNFADGGRKWAAVGAYWPAFWFRPDLTALPPDGIDDSGAAAGMADDDLEPSELRDYAAALAQEFGDGDPGRFASMAVAASGGGGPADGFADRLRALLATADDAAAAEHGELLGAPGSELVSADRDGGSFPAATFAAEADPEQVGGAAAFERIRERLARLRSGGAAAVARIINQASYYEMKARAGRVGQGLAAELAASVPAGVRIHLVGHSFGGRLVTAASAADGAPPLASMSLLQAAFSHNGLGIGFGDDRSIVGAFRRTVEERRVSGPILITHTHRDSAVGFFYAVASAASGVIASAFGLEALIGGPKDPHGGMGANGAQSMKNGETVAHIADGATIPHLQPGRVNNVLADAIVSEHNDVANAAVGALVWAAASA